MEFLSIYIFHLIFVYGMCRLDGKPFFVWPYAFYILIYVLVFWFYLCFVRFLLKAIQIAIEKIKNSFIRFICFVISELKKPGNKEEVIEEEKIDENEEKNVDSTQ